MKIHKILEQLGNVRDSTNGRYTASCPVPDHGKGRGDLNPSLSLKESSAGRIVVKCFAGCDPQSLVEAFEALGLKAQDVYVVDGTGPEEEETTGGLTLQAYAEAKRLPEDFLRDLGLTTIHLSGPVVRIPHFAGDGTETAVYFRLRLTGPNCFRWKSGSKPCLYGLERLTAARAAGRVTIVEGISDVHTLWFHDEPAIGLPGASSWKEAWAEYLDGIPVIHVVIEPDKGGAAVERWLAKSPVRSRVRLVRLDGVKDASELYLADPDNFLERWRKALHAAVPWDAIEAAERNREAEEAYGQAKELLEDPNLLQRISGKIAELGYAGDPSPALLAYVAMSSRLLERPLNLVLIAPSAAGKNYTLDIPAQLMPDDALYILKASSPRVLVYNDEEFTHKTIIMSEADSIPEEGPAASAVRSLVADNSMSYEVVEKTPATGRLGVRRIEKQGPTGLITTSTKSLAPQMATRVLEVSLRDDPQQTKAVLRSHAQKVLAARQEPPADVSTFIALQQWLNLAGARAVIVPFADVLAAMVPANVIRMRRDFRQLLTLIQAIALLHQCQRRRTAEGAIVAELKDYTFARELLVPIFEGIVTEGVTAAVRETVEAVNRGEEVSLAELARRLRLSRKTVHYRVKRAMQDGWLINVEDRKGHPFRLKRGALLPAVASVLPDPDAVQKALEGAEPSSDPRNGAPDEDDEEGVEPDFKPYDDNWHARAREFGLPEEAADYPDPVAGALEEDEDADWSTEFELMEEGDEGNEGKDGGGR